MYNAFPLNLNNVVLIPIIAKKNINSTEKNNNAKNTYLNEYENFTENKFSVFQLY